MAGTQSNPTPSHPGENDFLPAAIYISEGEAFSLRWTFEICIFPPGWDSSLLCQYRSATHDYISQIFESISSQIPAATVTFTRCKPADPHRADLETSLLSHLSTQDTRAIQSWIQGQFSLALTLLRSNGDLGLQKQTGNGSSALSLWWSLCLSVQLVKTRGLR